MNWDYYADPRPDIQAMVTTAGRSFLDVGCGEGALGAALKAAGAARVVGIEPTADAAAQARERLDDLIEGDAATVELPFAEGEFDYIVFADVLEHIAEPERVVQRVLPFLNERGRVVVSVPNIRFWTVLMRLIFDRWSYRDAGIRDRTHLRVFTRRSLIRMLDDVGLDVERLERNYRLIEDQSQIGRMGALATRVVRKTLAPLLFRDLMAFQYRVLARRRAGEG